MLGQLISGRTVPTFKAFYDAERSKIKFPLVWVHNNSLSRGITAAHQTEYAEGKILQHSIHLRTIPATKEDAVNIAHELVHAILDEEGFPGLIALDSTYREFAASLNSALHDPIVDARLAAYDFDIAEKYKREFTCDRGQLRSAILPHVRSDKLKWVANYLGKRLDIKFLSDYGVDDEGFLAWFHEKFPSISEESDRLMSKIESISFDTPGKMAQTLKAIVDDCGLSRMVLLSS